MKYFSSVWILRVATALMACGLALFLEWHRPSFVVRVDEGFRDSFVRLTASAQPEDRLVVVDINETALKEMGAWPWPRQKMADLVEILLSTYGAKAVGLDIVFPAPGDENGDARLASLATHAPLTLVQIFDFTMRNPAVLDGVLVGGKSQQPGHRGLNAYGYIGNHAGLSGARCIGSIGYQPDADGVLRHTPARTHYKNQAYAPFASALLECATSVSSEPKGDSQGLWRVPYSRELASYTVISAADILRENVPREWVSGRYVLVGSSSLGLGDRVSTPLAPLSAGVMVHAASLSGLLDLREGLAQAPWSGRIWLSLWCVLSIAFALVLMSRLAAWGGLLVLLGLVISWLIVAFAGVAHQAEWSVTAPLWAYFFLLSVGIPHEWWQAQRQTRRLMSTFSHYVAQPVLDEIVRLGLQHSLIPTKRQVTVLIADMQGYTEATSLLSLEEAATLTKDFLGCLTRPVLDGLGTLDKYTGDGLVAFWGAPLPCPDQADRAVSAGLAILKEVEALNVQRVRLGLQPVQVRIGVETGVALVGDLGTPFRSTYTAVGDCINFASRLETAARDLPTQMVIGSATQRQLLKHQTRSMGFITLRGTTAHIEVFCVNQKEAKA
jgi:adenylate cyclase